jgi:hypothetical protein
MWPVRYLGFSARVNQGFGCVLSWPPFEYERDRPRPKQQLGLMFPRAPGPLIAIRSAQCERPTRFGIDLLLSRDHLQACPQLVTRYRRFRPISPTSKQTITVNL